MNRILVCYDGSPESRRALERVGEPARQGPANATVIIVVEPLYVTAPYSGYVDPTEHATHRCLLDEATETLAACGVWADPLEPADKPAPAITGAPRAVRADLVVIGAGHRSGPLPLRTVTDDVVAGAPSDVLVVR